MKKYPTIYLEQKVHKKRNRVLIRFTYHKKLIEEIKKIPDTYWSKTLQCWHTTFSTEQIELLKNRLKLITNVDKSALDKKRFIRTLNADQKKLLNAFYLYLKGKRYSKSTVDTYTFFVADFISFHSKTELDALENRAVELFIEQVFIERKYAVSTQRQFISALKVFLKFYPHTQINNLTLERPKKSRKLPEVLSQEEVLKIISVTHNLKHRAIIAIIYSCGLRISELINLRLQDFHIERKQLVIKNSKGRKDRYVSLADSFMPLLSNYYNSYTPEFYFIEGSNKGKYSAQSIRQFLKKSCEKAQILKNVTPHTLRHSYATHLLENGVDIRYIQSLLGHAKPETTMIYTHVKRKDLMEIQNPLDVALQKINKTAHENKKIVLSGKY